MLGMKKIRDPIHGFIHYSDEEQAIIDSLCFQRLRGIKQLALTCLVYPGAMHTRFEHSLGVLYMATRICNQLRLDEENTKLVRWAAFLHDVGQGPLSHTFEPVLESMNDFKVDHEDVTVKILKEDEEFKHALDSYEDSIVSIFSDDNESIGRRIISGSIDADKLDYFIRDSYHTGVKYGLFDCERILHTLSKREDRDRAYITTTMKGKEALEDFKLARYLMHSQVYSHHARFISDSMFVRGSLIAARDRILEKDLLNLKNSQFLKYYFSLDDSSISELVIRSNVESNAKIYFKDLMNRRLFKRFIEWDTSSLDFEQKENIREGQGVGFTRVEEGLAEECGCDPDFIIVTTQKISVFKDEKVPLLIETEEGRVTELEDYSPIEYKTETVEKFFILCPEEFRDGLRERLKNKENVFDYF